MSGFKICRWRILAPPPPKRLPTSFSSVTSASVRTSPQTFLAFSFNFFATLVYNFKAIPSHSQTIELEP